jgi:hypothetical protein
VKIAVYTANIGNYDILHNIYIKNKGVDFYYITDSRAEVLCGWTKIVVDELPHKDPTKAARWYKTHSHELFPNHDITIWIDARFMVKSRNIIDFIDKNIKKKSLIGMYHHMRDAEKGCLYVEGFVCGSNGLDDDQVILNQITRYKEEGFPRKFGLFSTGVIVRRKHEKVAKFNELWWSEIEKGSKRDQVSQMYAAWKTDLKIQPLDGNVYGNELVVKSKHIHKLPRNAK